MLRLLRPKPEPIPDFCDRFHPDTVIPVPPASPAELEHCEALLGVPLPPALKRVLSMQNGGYFAGGLLHLMGACRAFRHADLATWNQPHLWKAAYPGYELEQYVFFADDVFGNQFGYRPDDAEPTIWRFDIQQGEFTAMADSTAAFLNEVLVDDGPWLLGADYLNEYRESGREWQVGQQLAHVIPGLLGGSMTPENLQPMDSWINLHMAGQAVTKIKPLPPGTEVRGFTFDQETLTLRVNIHR